MSNLSNSLASLEEIVSCGASSSALRCDTFSKEEEMKFLSAAQEGKLDMLKHLISLNPHINIHMYNDQAFRMAVTFGHLDVVKYLISLGKINIHLQNNNAFTNAAGSGYMELFKYLLELASNTDIHSWSEDAFKLAAMNGKLEALKYLLELDPNLNVHIDDDYAFRFAAYDKRIDVVVFLLQFEPKYILKDLNTTQRDIIEKAIKLRKIATGKIIESYLITDLSNMIVDYL